MHRSSTYLLALVLLVPPAFAAPTKPLPPPKADKTEESTVPAGSGDYSKMLAEAVRYKKGQITFEQLKKYVVAAKLPPHVLRCGYLIAPVPAPPPGIPYNPGMMPPSWEHTFGEVTMTYWTGKITREEYDRLHEAAHHDEPGYPNCMH